MYESAWRSGVLPSSRLGLLGLLELPDLEQRVGVDDVGDGPVAVESVVARHGLPPVGPHAELLGEEGDEDLGLLLAEAGQLLHAPQELLAGGGLGPEPGDVAVIAALDERGELLQPRRHG